jgi:hypothetical protein
MTPSGGEGEQRERFGGGVFSTEAQAGADAEAMNFGGRNGSESRGRLSALTGTDGQPARIISHHNDMI